MANKKTEIKYSRKKVNTLMDNLKSNMDMLYRTQYNTDRSYSTDLGTITDDIENNIDKIIGRNNSSDVSNITRIYTRLKLKESLNDSKLGDHVGELFGDNALNNSILNSYISNKYVKDLNDEIDSICRYMTKIQEALDAKKDAILSSDNYAKDFLDATCDVIGSEDRNTFAENFEKLKTKYDLPTKIEQYVDRTQKYGEEFVYSVPYKKALEELIRRKNSTIAPTRGFMSSPMQETVLIENGSVKDNNLNKYVKSNNIIGSNLKITFDFSGIMQSAIEESTMLREVVTSINENTISINEVGEEYGTNTRLGDLDKSIPDTLDLPENDKTNDGLFNTNKLNNKGRIKTPGAVVKRLVQENVLPIYIDDICMGYYYIEFTNGRNGYDLYTNTLDSYNNLNYTSPASKTTASMSQEENKTQILRYISGMISQKIDTNFINNNQDLAKEIYAILSHNDIFNAQNSLESIRVSFLSNDDVIHWKFNEDPDTHRGISDIANCLIPAKLYSCLYITNTLGILTRGQDKRVYYVKQNVETNISQTLLNVINQIKKSNFNLRQIENMNSIINITGRFNDYVIPVGPSGDSPIQFEVMPGQEFNPYTELMEQLESMAINIIGVPIELLNARESIDFATQITMSNTKFLRHCYNRQSKAEIFISKLLTIIYNAEYDENVTIKCNLPTPLFLNMSNLTNVLENVKNTATMISEYEYDSSDDGNTLKKELFIKQYMRTKLSSYVKINEIEKMKEQADLEYKVITNKPKNEQE